MSSHTNLSFIQVLSKVFDDIILIYKNFFHWNISKICIYFFSLLFGIALAFPFFLLLGILSYFDPIDWKQMLGSIDTNYFSVIATLFEYPVFVFVEILVFLLGISVMIMTLIYTTFLQFNLIHHYFTKEKLGYKENPYFSLQKWWDISLIAGLIGLYILIPILIGVIALVILYTIFGSVYGFNQVLVDMATSPLNPFFIIVSLLILTTFLVCIYVSYRLMFTYITYIDGGAKKGTVKKSISDSFKSTISVKYLLYFVSVFIVFGIITTLISFPVNTQAIQNQEIDDYFVLSESSGAILDEEKFSEDYTSYLYEGYGKQDITQIAQTYKINSISIMIFTFFSFLFITGLQEVIIYSFYNRVLKHT